MLKVDRLDRSNIFNDRNDCRMIASCCAVTGRKLLTLSGVADTYTFLMNTWNALPESYQQRVYNNFLSTVWRQIQQAENPMPAVLISVEAARVDNAILLDYSASNLAVEEPEIRSTDPNIPINNNCTDEELHFGMPGGSRDYNDEGDEGYNRDAIPTTSQRRRPGTELERFDRAPVTLTGMRARMGTMRMGMMMRRKYHRKSMMDQRRMLRTDLGPSDVDRYEGEDGDDVDVD
jgi:hypothetical protein